MKFKILSVILGLALIAFAIQANAAAIDVNVIAPNASDTLISQANGNYSIQFKVFDSNNALDVNAKITLNTGDIIKDSYNLKNSGNCSGIDFSSTQTCSFDWNSAGINGSFKVNVTVVDSEGSMKADSSDNFFTADNTAPSGLAISINNNSSMTSNPQVSLSLSAGSDAKKMQFSCDNSSFTSLETYASNKSFNLISGPGCNSNNGIRTVYFKAADLAGNVSASVSDSIFLDTVAPQVSITQPSNGSFDKNSRPNVKATISDNASGFNLDSLNFTIDGTKYNLGNYGSYSLSFSNDSNTLSLTPFFDFNQLDTHTIKIDINDFANNKSTTTSTFTIDNNAASPAAINGSVLGRKSVFLSWQKPVFDGADISFYKIYRSASPINEGLKGGFYYAQTSGTFFEDASIVVGSTYHYYVTSVDYAGNESQLSNDANFTINGFVTLTPDNNTITMQEGTSYSLELTMHNGTRQAQDVSLSVSSDDSRLDADLGATSFRLNQNESTTFALSLNAQSNVGSGTHTVTVQVSYAGTVQFSQDFTVIIGDMDFVDFSLQNSEVCNDQYRVELPVTISNLGSSTKTINLSATGNVFLPYWNQSSVTISGNNSETIDLILQNQPSNNLQGDYSVQVTASSGARNSVQELTFTMNDCQTQDTDFSLNANTQTISLSKNNSQSINYWVVNNSNNDQYINISVDSDLQVDYNSLIFVTAGNSYYDHVRVRAGAFTEPSQHKLTITASNGDFSKDKEIKINVQKTHYFELSASENSFDIAQGVSKTIQLYFKNADYDEDFTVSSDSSDSAITATLGTTSFELSEKSSKTVPLTITIPQNAGLGNETITVRAWTGNTSTKTFKINLNVIEGQPTPESTIVDLQSYPTQIQLDNSQSKELTFIVYNPSSNAANLSISLNGLPDGVIFESVLQVIPPKTSRTITGIITAQNAKSGNFEVLQSFTAFGNSQTKILKISVGSQGLFEGIASGLASLGQSVGLGVIAILIIIVLLVVFSKAGGEKPKPEWMQK